MKDLWFFLRLFKPYRLWLLAGLILSLLTALASIALLGLSGWFICAAAVAGVLAPDGVAVTFNFMQPAAQIRALAIIRTLARYGERLLTHEATFRVLAKIRCWFFAKMIPLAPGRLAMQRSGDLLNRMTGDIDALDALYLRLLAPLAVALLASLALTAFIGAYSPLLATLLMGMLLIAAVFVPWLFNRLGNKGAEQESEYTAEFKGRQIEILQGFNDLSAFQAYNRFKDRLLTVSEKLLIVQADNERLASLSAASMQVLAQLTVIIMVIVGASLMERQTLSGPVVALLVFAILALFEWLNPLAQATQMLGKTRNAARRIRTLAESEPAIGEPSNARPLPPGNRLALEQVSFRYRQDGDWVLQHIDLSLAEGDKIAISGPSGAGKSTLLHLLMRFFDPQQGRILLDGVDISQIRSERLLSRMALLSQRSHLFNGSIRDNLLLGDREADDGELMDAIKLAGLSAMLSRLPAGIDTLVGEQGAKVSGGEARRIALARVYLKNAPILLLDEPTEGLDAETEDDVLSALQQISENKTLLMVTHRAAGFRLAQRVYRMEAGELIEV
ncbi:thiol reductant ABC exporter subunit CydC [Methylomarinum sp. Ch1-1]|uniref:Thiol reductant ABC exporter subunit CydC n=1 Tax=Methylomarinum roseum TaxID=3067653 RepID=A0AAU7NSK8_9GAMM